MAAFANGAETVNASLNLLKTKARLDQRGATCDDRNIAADGPKRVVSWQGAVGLDGSSKAKTFARIRPQRVELAASRSISRR
jgi:hypothetical protein